MRSDWGSLARALVSIWTVTLCRPVTSLGLPAVSLW